MMRCRILLGMGTLLFFTYVYPMFIDQYLLLRSADNIQHDNKKKRACYGILTTSVNHRIRIEAQLRLAVIYYNGLYGVEKSTCDAYHYWYGLTQQKYDRSIQAQAYEMLGYYYQDGQAPVKQDEARALQYFELARDACCIGSDNDIRKRIMLSLENRLRGSIPRFEFTPAEHNEEVQ